MRVLELVTCPGCGSGALETFELGGHDLHRCRACQLVSAPDYADPAGVYVDGYMFGGAGQFGPGFDVRHPLFQRYLRRVAVRRIEMIERATGIRGGRLLDVGCGTGEVLLAAQARGWAVQGVEPERTGADVARERGLDVSVSTLEESGLPERSFDVVSAFHVLEHMPDSRAFLGTLARWVRPGGFVTIEVPNWASFQRRRLGADWPHLRPREHLAYFTPDTLPQTLRRSGIEPVLTRSPTYVGAPQTLGDALADLARQGRYRKLLEQLSPTRTVDGRRARYPGRLGWAVLRVTEAMYDRAGVGTVVFCVGRVGGSA